MAQQGHGVSDSLLLDWLEHHPMALREVMSLVLSFGCGVRDAIGAVKRKTERSLDAGELAGGGDELDIWD